MGDTAGSAVTFYFPERRSRMRRGTDGARGRGAVVLAALRRDRIED
jgi:hypothetical protein